jgi:hypothetical protein
MGHMDGLEQVVVLAGPFTFQRGLRVGIEVRVLGAHTDELETERRRMRVI